MKRDKSAQMEKNAERGTGEKCADETIVGRGIRIYDDRSGPHAEATDLGPREKCAVPLYNSRTASLRLEARRS